MVIFFLFFFSLVAWGSETLRSEMSHLLLSATLYAADVAFISLSGVGQTGCRRLCSSDALGSSVTEVSGLGKTAPVDSHAGDYFTSLMLKTPVVDLSD